MANHHHENEVATVCGSKIQGPKDSASFDETVTLDASLRQVAGTLGYSDPLYTRSRFLSVPDAPAFIHISTSLTYVRVRTWVVQVVQMS